MKKFVQSILCFLIPLTLSAQIEFEWETQFISERNNMKSMNIVNDTTTLLAGYGRTFVVSKDQGNSWDNIKLLDPQFDWGDISINSSGLGYACAGDEKVVDNPSGGEPDVYAEGVLLKTTDFGATWTVMDVTEITETKGGDMDENKDPTMYPNAFGCYFRHFRAVEVLDDNSVFLSLEWNFWNAKESKKVSCGGTMKSSDGITWTPITDNGRYSMAIEATSSSIYYGGYNHLYRAEAGSDVVHDIYTALTTAAGDETVFINDVTIVDENKVFVITSTNGIFLTTDQGASFSMLANGAPTGGNDMIVINDNVWMVQGTSAKSKTTLNGGTTWEDNFPGSTCYEIGGIMNDSVVAMGKSNLYKIAVQDLTAGTYTWNSQTISENNNLQKMAKIDNNKAIIVGYGNTLLETEDAGTTWNAVETPELFVYGADYDYASVSTTEEASYMVTARFSMVDYPVSMDTTDVYAHGLIFKSTDLWQTWEILETMNIGTGDDPAFNPNVEKCYGLHTTEIGALNDTTAFMYVTWLDSLPGVENKVTHSNVFKTEDGGDSWLPIFEDLGGNYVNNIFFIDDKTGYIIGNTFLRKTEDGGKTFIDLYPALQTTGSPTDSTLFLNNIQFIDDDSWYVNSQVDGIFLTNDGGVTYEELPGIGGSSDIYVLNDSSIIALGSSTRSKISWDYGQSWTICYPGSSVWGIGGVLDNKLIGLAKTNLYKIPLSDLEAPSAEADILSFVLADQIEEAVIDPSAATVSIEVAAGTNAAALTPTITVSEGAKINPDSETEQDFSAPVAYAVTAENLSTQKIWTVTVTVAVGVKESVRNVSIYPNPAKEILHLNNLQNTEYINIYSASGSKVLSENVQGDMQNLDISNLEEGIYIVTLIEKDGKIWTEKIVISK